MTEHVEEVSITFHRAGTGGFHFSWLASVSNSLGLIVRGRLCEDYSRRQLESKGESRQASVNIADESEFIPARRVRIGKRMRSQIAPLSLSPRALREEQRLPLRSMTNGEAWETVSHSTDRVATLLRCAIGVRRITIESRAGAAITFAIPGRLRLTMRRDPRGNS